MLRQGPSTTVGASTTALVYDANNRLTNRKVAGSVVETYTWDTEHGYRTRQGPTTNPAATVLGYSPTGRLTSYATSAGVSATYTYDAGGQRTRSVVRSGGTTTTTDWTYEGLALLSVKAESTGSTTASWTIDYLYDGSGRPYAGVYRPEAEAAASFTFVTTDRGDVVGLLDKSGVAFAAYRYDAWGRSTSTTSQGTARIGTSAASRIAARQPLRYAGYCYDEESGLYYLSARHYDPVSMQFLTKDPAKADGEESAYQYCGGDPVGKVDPSGLAAKPVALLIWGRNIKNPPYFFNIAGYWSYNYGRNGYRPVVVRGFTMSEWKSALGGIRNIKLLVYFGHGASHALYLSDVNMYTGDVRSLPRTNLRSDAKIRIYGCEAGRTASGIAAAFSSHFKRSTYGARGGVSYVAYQPVVTWEHRDQAYPMSRQWVWR